MPRRHKELSWSQLALAGMISAALMVGFTWGYHHLGPFFNSAF